MNETVQHHCPNCGGALTGADAEWLKCKYCGSIFENQSFQRRAQSMRELLDQAKLEYINNQRRNLYDAVHAKYISTTEVRQYATEIKKHLPDDFQANFYLQALSGNTKEINRAIRRIDADANYDSLPAVIHFLIASLQVEYLLELNNLVERAYKKRDLALFSRFATEISQEAEKVSNGIYATGIPRDVFIAYSSKDMEQVSELCEELESQGISCFVAARNLRHGVGSVENYDDALKDAMNNCRCFVFVSSPNSRSLACDAVTKEIPYLRSRDIENAPAHLRNNYAAIPDAYKKYRVEYRIGTQKSTDAGSKITDAFFEGYEWAYTAEAVAVRVFQLLYEKPADASTADVPPAPRLPKSKKKSKTPIIAVASLLLAGAVTAGALLLPGMVDRADSSLNSDSAGQSDTNENLSAGNAAGGETAKNNNAQNASEGLVFASIGGGNCRVSGIGTCTDTNVIIPDYSPKGDKVTEIADEAFQNNYNITTVKIPDSVTYIGKNAFKYCHQLTSIGIPAAVTEIGQGAFQYCSKLEYISVNHENKRYVSMSYCLIDKTTKTLVAACKKSVIPQDGSVTSIGAGAFAGVVGISSIYLPYGITSIGDDAFTSCRIETPIINIPGSVTSIGARAFAYSDISTLSIEAEPEHIGEDAFLCNSIEKISVNSDNKKYQGRNNCLIDIEKKELLLVGKNFLIPQDGSVVRIADNAFANNDMTSLTLPDGITHIGAKAFLQCRQLRSITLSANLIEIGKEAFSYCNSLSEIHIPASVQSIGSDAFSSCPALSKITVDPNNPFYHVEGNRLIQTATQTVIHEFAGTTLP